MSDPFSRANDRIFARLGLPARHFAGGLVLSNGDARVVLRQPDETLSFGGTQVRASTTMLDVRLSDCPTVSDGDTFVVTRNGVETVYTVEGKPERDSDRLVWSCGCRGS